MSKRVGAMADDYWFTETELSAAAFGSTKQLSVRELRGAPFGGDDVNNYNLLPRDALL